MISINQPSHQAQYVFDAEASSSTIPPQKKSIPCTRFNLEKTIQELDTLKTIEGSLDQFIQEIKQKTNKIEKEIKEINQEKEKLKIELEKNQDIINKSLISTDLYEQDKHLTNIDKINQRIYKTQTSVNQLRINKNKLKNEIELKEIKTKTTISTKEKIEEKIKKEENIKRTKENDQKSFYIQGSYISSLGELRDLLLSQLEPLLIEINKSVSHIKEKEIKSKLISDFTISAIDIVMEEFSKKLKSNRKYSSEETIREKILIDHKNLISKLKILSNGKMGLQINRSLLSFPHVATIIACTGLYIFLSRKYGIRQGHSLKEGQKAPAFEKEIAAFASIISILINTSIQVYLSRKYEHLSPKNLSISGEKKIQQLSKSFNIQITTLTDQSSQKKELKKIIEKTIGLTQNKFNIWTGKKNTEINRKINEITTEIQNKSTEIEELEEEKERNNTHIRSTQKQTFELSMRIQETSTNISSLLKRIEIDEKILHRIHDKGKHIASEKSKTLDALWSTIKQLKNKIDECDMKQETLQARLSSLALNLQEHDTQLSAQQSKVLKQMAEVDGENIAQHLLMPNMTEHAFERLVQRHHGIALNQLRQRVEKGRFKNSEGVTIQAAAKQASTYTTFYHLLYATIDAIDFVNKSQNIVPRNDYTIQHAIEVGLTHTESSGLRQKNHSIVSYTPRIDKTTGQQRMVIEHMY